MFFKVQTNSPLQDGTTTLQMSALGGHTAITCLLLEHKAHVDQADEACAYLYWCTVYTYHYSVFFNNKVSIRNLCSAQQSRSIGWQV
jgi:hypothetical protein